MSNDTDGNPSPSGAPEPAQDTEPPAEAGSPPADDGVPEPPAADTPPAKPARTGTITARERAERQRDEKLESIKEQVQSGSLVIRQMTDEERERYPARDEPPKRPRSR